MSDKTCGCGRGCLHGLIGATPTAYALSDDRQRLTIETDNTARGKFFVEYRNSSNGYYGGSVVVTRA